MLNRLALPTVIRRLDRREPVWMIEVWRSDHECNASKAPDYFFCASAGMVFIRSLV